jgi:integrase
MRVSRSVPTTITEAKRVESKILQDLIHGRFEILKNRKNPTFRQYAEDYKKSVTWQKSYGRTVISIRHLIDYFGNKRLTEITTHDFSDFRTKRIEQGVGSGTINREHACLLRMINLAIQSEDYLISKNPLKPIKFLKEKPVENRELTIEEYHKILDAAPRYFQRIIFFACNTGMRKMEILNTQFKQIRLWHGGADIELLDTKSGEKEYVPLSEETFELVCNISYERGFDLNNMTDEEKEQYIFTGLKGQRLKSVRKPMITTFKRAGIELRLFHTFRHFWTKTMFEAGNDPAYIQKVGCWRDFKTMLKYCYTSRSQEHEAMNKLSQYISKKPAKIVDMRQYNGNANNL